MREAFSRHPVASTSAVDAELFNFTPHILQHHALGRRRTYANAVPFPHTFFDDIFPRKTALAVAAEIPELMQPSGCVAGAAACYRKPGVHYRKSELHGDAMGPYTKRVFRMLRSGVFVRFLETLSGIGGLVPDPGFEGSGVHMTGDGGVLAVHHDFNWMLCSMNSASGGYGDCSRPGGRQPLRGHETASDRVRLHRRVVSPQGRPRTPWDPPSFFAEWTSLIVDHILFRRLAACDRMSFCT